MTVEVMAGARAHETFKACADQKLLDRRRQKKKQT